MFGTRVRVTHNRDYFLVKEVLQLDRGCGMRCTEEESERRFIMPRSVSNEILVVFQVINAFSRGKTQQVRLVSEVCRRLYLHFGIFVTV
jgi:hypothetical protein